MVSVGPGDDPNVSALTPPGPPDPTVTLPRSSRAGEWPFRTIPTEIPWQHRWQHRLLISVISGTPDPRFQAVSA